MCSLIVAETMFTIHLQLRKGICEKYVQSVSISVQYELAPGNVEYLGKQITELSTYQFMLAMNTKNSLRRSYQFPSFVLEAHTVSGGGGRALTGRNACKIRSK